jgi:hypothetical protein
MVTGQCHLRPPASCHRPASSCPPALQPPSLSPFLPQACHPTTPCTPHVPWSLDYMMVADLLLYCNAALLLQILHLAVVIQLRACVTPYLWWSPDYGTVADPLCCVAGLLLQNCAKMFGGTVVIPLRAANSLISWPSTLSDPPSILMTGVWLD